MARLSLATQLLRQMGPRWLLFRAAYAARQRSGWDAWRLPVSTWQSTPLSSLLCKGVPAEPQAYEVFRRQSDTRLFIPPGYSNLLEAWDAGDNRTRASAERARTGEFQFFGAGFRRCGMPPDWHVDPFSGRRFDAARHWSRTDEFGAGDIKLVWELNRFGFAFALVRAYRRTLDESFAECFWQLVDDWYTHNPPQVGVNWKCGQETSFRAMAWCFGLYGLKDAAASSPERVARLAQMLAVSGRRIASNLGYALSQRNNHGISEATGLWTLGILFPEFRQSAKWLRMGRAGLESQARELIYDDGGFSQHSVNYHRVMLDDYVWSIQLGRANGIELSSELVRRVGLAGKWLEAQLDTDTGRLPNWGSNDGAQVLPLTNCDYLDYRPVVQSVSVAVSGRPSLPAGPWDEQRWWLGLPLAHAATTPTHAGIGLRDFPDTGLTVLRADSTRAQLRSARRFRHRPAQCDLLHLDLRSGSTNILRDCGTFSYNAPDDAGSYFKSVAAHNTIQFDNHDQMPALGRFLYGEWPRGEARLFNDRFAVTASYQDWQGCRHERTVTLTSGRCLVADRISGFRREATLRWHLCPETEWVLTDSCCASPLAVIQVSVRGTATYRPSMGWESLYYNTKTSIQVFEITVPVGVVQIDTEILVPRTAREAHHPSA